MAMRDTTAFINKKILIGITVAFVATFSWPIASVSKDVVVAQSLIGKVFIPFSNDFLFTEQFSDGRNAGFCATDSNRNKLMHGIDGTILKKSALSRNLIGKSMQNNDVMRKIFSMPYWPLICDIFAINDVSVDRSYNYLITGSYFITSFSGKASWFLRCQEFRIILDNFERIFVERLDEADSDSSYLRDLKRVLNGIFQPSTKISISSRCSDYGDHSFFVRFSR